MPGPEARKEISKIGFCLLVFVFFLFSSSFHLIIYLFNIIFSFLHV